MKLTDLFIIALYNLKAGKHMVKKIIFGMAIIIFLIICSVAIIVSYFKYKEAMEQKNMSDCYYYMSIEEQKLSYSGIQKIFQESEMLNRKYESRESVIICRLSSTEKDMKLNAENIGISINNSNYDAKYKKSHFSNTTFYKNVNTRQSSIEFALFNDGMTVFPSTVKEMYGDRFMIGEYPKVPGEIMLDDYILETYGIDDEYDELIGQNISFLYYDDEQNEQLIHNYKISGIFLGETLSKRENVYTSDLHIEHIYVNLKEEDMEKFYIPYGSIRCYFDNYTEYVNQYNYISDVLQYNVDEVIYNENEIRLTAKGMTYCIIHFFMENVGKLLVIIECVIALIITFSIIYIFKFYTDRQKEYQKMLGYIGMKNKDRQKIALIENSLLFMLSSCIGIYFSIIFIFIINYFTTLMLEFSISINAMNCICAILLGWLYINVCRGLCVIFSKSS